MFAHKLEENEIYRFIQTLNAGTPPDVKAFIEYLLPYNPEDRGRLWTVEFSSFSGVWEIEGPCGISLRLSKTVCYFHHYIRWRNFLVEDDLQRLLRACTYGFAHYVHSEWAIYVPDSAAKESGVIDFVWDEDARDLCAMRQWLLDNCGEPSPTLREIYQEFEDYADSDGYYIDDFKDLKAC
ncbi:hypothetical protein QWJ34_22255 [Saccharibacillus sp. CPCC 101409]|uniref:hypothetical protein n=1 Tax=Saccharibacillus sp. CPCC 101409 TaxID=3058041 RepID=UPI0026736153|nr:hypothetical protein [Saccharibacillus sp. CPCC 101409]MDO3412504.1 hypothetical protein [Saccharibacillus sp. CPCC 101409]